MTLFMSHQTLSHRNTDSMTDAARPDASPIRRFVRLPEVLAAVGVAERTLYDLMRRGEFPRPAKIGAMSVWVEDEIAQWQRARLSERSAKH